LLEQRQRYVWQLIDSARSRLSLAPMSPLNQIRFTRRGASLDAAKMILPQR